jgi:hypothetical protein
MEAEKASIPPWDPSVGPTINTLFLSLPVLATADGVSLTEELIVSVS